MQFDSSQEQYTTPTSCLRKVLFCCRLWMSICRAVSVQMRFRSGPLIFCLQCSVVKLYSSSPFILATLYLVRCLHVVWIFLYKDCRDSFDCSGTWWCSGMSMQFWPCEHAVQKSCFPCLMILCIKVIWAPLKIVYQRSSFRIVLRLISLDHAVHFFARVQLANVETQNSKQKKERRKQSANMC